MTRRNRWTVALAIGAIGAAVLGFGVLRYYRRAMAIQSTSLAGRACNELIVSGNTWRSCDDWGKGTEIRKDGWGEPMHCHIREDGRFEIVSFGADGKRGGTGNASDIHCYPEWKTGNMCACSVDHQ